MSLDVPKKDKRICPKCQERELVRIDRWGNITEECLNCDYGEIIIPSWKNPDHKPTAKGMF